LYLCNSSCASICTFVLANLNALADEVPEAPLAVADDASEAEEVVVVSKQNKNKIK
jgi:hypothetical protein